MPTTLSSRESNHDTSAAKKAAFSGLFSSWIATDPRMSR